MDDHRSQYRLNIMCRVLGVSVSGYHSWRRRPISNHQQQDALLKQRIHDVYRRRKARYGAPRIHAELQAEGLSVSSKRSARLMRAGGLRAKGKRRSVRTTDSNHRDPVFPNLLDRQFNVQQPNQVWAADMTYIPTKEGWLYLAVTLDLFSRTVVGYAMDAQMPATLPLAALQMAVQHRDPLPGLLHHSDQGSGQASSWGGVALYRCCSRRQSVLPKKPVYEPSVSSCTGSDSSAVQHESQGRMLG